MKGLAAFGLCLAFTSAGLAVGDGFTGPWATVGTLAVLTAANLAATVVRFVLMRTWVFARGAHHSAHRATTPAAAGTANPNEKDIDHV